MDEMRNPGIRLDSVIIIELNFKRSPNVPPDLQFNIEISSSAETNQQKTTLQEKLTVIAKSAGGDFIQVMCTMIGQFSCIENEKNMSLEEFAQASAPAIIYPFCREAIASVSMKSGTNPILLPPFNFYALAKQQEATKQDGENKKS